MADVSPEVAGALLLTIRWFVVLRLQPHWSLALGRLWWPVAFGIALGVAVTTETVAAPGTVGGWATAIGSEVMLGAGVGVLASLPAFALLGGVSASAAALRTMPLPFVRMCTCAALVAALSLRMHHGALMVLRDQAVVLPPGRPSSWLPSLPDLLGTLAVQLDGLLMLALTLATPVLLTIVVVRSLVAVVGAGPSVARPFADVVGPGLGTVAALVAFATCWSVYPQGWARSAISVAAG